jgi:enoyl-CoA hydratase/carnithine racemase
MDKSELPIVERRGPALWITFNRPERRNALNKDVFEVMQSAIAEADCDPGVRVVVITGTGDKAFSAGADLHPDMKGNPFEFDWSNPDHFATRFFRMLETIRVPLVARVNGAAYAGGLSLVAACDLAVAVDTAKFCAPEAGLGFFPIHVLPYLIRNVPRKVLLQMSLTAEPLSAEDARTFGLVNWVVPASELDAKVDWLVNRLASNSPAGIGTGKQIYRAMSEMHIDQALSYADTSFAFITQSEDTREGLAAFNQKRKPRFTGR